MLEVLLFVWLWLKWHRKIESETDIDNLNDISATVAISFLMALITLSAAHIFILVAVTQGWVLLPI